MKHTIIPLLLAATAWGQNVSAISTVVGDTDIYIKATISASADTKVCWHTATFTNCTDANVSDSILAGAGTTQEFVLYGFQPNTQYYYAFYLNDGTTRLGDGGAGAPPYTFTTTNNATHPQNPTAPTSSGITGVTPTSFGTTGTAANCADIQTKINACGADGTSANHEIIVPYDMAGCTSITLPSHSGSGKCVVRSSRLDRMPPDNARVDVAYDLQHAWQLRPALGTTAVSCSSGAKGYILAGLDILAPTGTQSAFQADLGSCTESYIDRSFLRAKDSPDDSATIVRLNGSFNGVLNSYVQSYHDAAGPSAIALDCGDRNLVQNNKLVGLGVTLFLTADCLPTTAAVNQDISIRKNTIVHINYDLGATSCATCTRQATEIKSAVRVEFVGNIIGPFPAQDIGNTAALLITPRIGSGGCNISGGTSKTTVSDVDFRRNLVLRNGSGLVSMEGRDDTAVCEPYPTRRIRFMDNIVTHIDTSYCLAGGAGCEPRGHIAQFDGCTDCQFIRNTVYESTFSGRGRILTVGQMFCGHCKFDNNLIVAGTGEISRGIGWRGGVDAGDGWPDTTDPQLLTPKQKLDRLWTNYSFTNNVIRVKSPNTTADLEPKYPSGNFWPGDDASGLTAMGYDSAASTSATKPRSFRLNEFNSTYRNKSTDGRSAGANYIGVMEEVGGIERCVVAALTSTTITLGCSAFGGMTTPGTAIKADINTSSTFANAPTRVTCSVNAAIPSWQTCEFTSLTTQTDYYVRVFAGGEPYAFSTAIRTR